MSTDEELRTVYCCKTCREFVWGNDRFAHMMTAHFVYTKSAAEHFGEGIEVQPIIVPEDFKPGS